MKSSESSKGIHRLLTLGRCPRRYGYRYKLGLHPRDENVSEALTLGNAVHAGLEVKYTRQLGGEVTDDMLANLSAGMLRAPKAVGILERYEKRYATEKLTVLAVEKEYEVTIPDPSGMYEPLSFTRRIDLVSTTPPTDRVFFNDHKTAASGSRREKTADIDPALLSQEVVGRAIFGNRWGGVVLNIIPTVDEWAFSRVVLSFSERRVREMPTGIYRLLLEERRLGGSVWEYPQAWACVDRYGTCEYKELCDIGPDALGGYEAR